MVFARNANRVVDPFCDGQRARAKRELSVTYLRALELASRAGFGGQFSTGKEWSVPVACPRIARAWGSWLTNPQGLTSDRI